MSANRFSKPAATACAATTASATPPSKRRPHNARGALGRAGEEAVVRHLREHGFRILARNARVQRLEIDIVAQRGELLVFCEVRSRSAPCLVAPESTVRHEKLRHMRQAAGGWLAGKNLGGVRVRIDVAGVIFPRDGGAPQIRYIENASLPFRWVR